MADVAADDARPDGAPKKIPLRKGVALFKRFWPFLRRERRTGAYIAFLEVVAIPAGVISPLLIKQIFDESVKNGDVDGLIRYGVTVLGLTLCSHVLRMIAALRVVGMKNRVRHRLVKHMYGHVLRLPLAYFHGTETGYVMARMREDVAALDGLMLDRVLDAVIDAFRAVLFLTLLLSVDAGLALTGLALFAVIAAGVVALSGPLRRRSEENQEAQAKNSAALHQTITGIPVVRTAAQEPSEGRRVAHSLRSAVRAAARLGVLHVGVGYTIGLALAIGMYLILAVGAYRVVNHDSTIGTLFAFSIYLTYVVGAVTALMQLNPELQRSFAALDRIFRFLDEPEERGDEPRHAPTAIDGRVTFEQVSFSYGRDLPALVGVDLDVRAGEVVALVGRSGAGKSTLVGLIPRLHDPDAGRVLVDGVDVRRYDLRALRRPIGVVPQDVFLFNRTVRENIAFARPTATEEEIRAAARDAYCDLFIERLPRGLDTLVGERGVKLSGGEKQRIAIAREILRDPAILILDEATSSLDTESEALIRAAIERLKVDRTCFLIAHRLSTVIDADRIVVLERGRIAQVGTHGELLERGGIYRKLYETQFGARDAEAAELASEP